MCVSVKCNSNINLVLTVIIPQPILNSVMLEQFTQNEPDIPDDLSPETYLEIQVLYLCVFLIYTPLKYTVLMAFVSVLTACHLDDVNHLSCDCCCH